MKMDPAFNWYMAYYKYTNLQSQAHYEAKECIMTSAKNDLSAFVVIQTKQGILDLGSVVYSPHTVVKYHLTKQVTKVVINLVHEEQVGISTES